MLSLIAAVGKNRVIGKDNGLPWHLPVDLKHFKDLTTGHTVIMGLKTYESIGRPLPNRINIVLTSDTSFTTPGCLVAHSLDEAIGLAHDDAFIIGGANLYAQALDRVGRMYLTCVHASPDGDVFFPEFDITQWKEVSREEHKADEENEYDYSFVTLEKYETIS
ncbi:MAG: dihydrofolate reductase [bacterium]|nr:dihydrofolate reductase [bacterium]